MKTSQPVTIFDLAKPPEINAVGFSYFNAGWYQKLRVFFDYELIFMLDGEMVFLEEGDEIRVRPGEVILLSPYRINSSLPISGSARIIYLHFKSGIAPRTMSRESWHRTIKRSIGENHAAENSFSLRGPIGLGRWMRPTGIWDELISLLKAAIKEKQSMASFGELSASLSISQVLLLLSRNMLEGGTAPLIGERSPSQKLIHQADTVIQNRYSDGLNVGDLARSLNVTPQHLIRTFQDHCGETPLARLHRVRLQKAQELLKQTTLSVKEISTMIGMSNINHFCRFFRKETGASPGKWRVQI